jgi:23S rRNA (adenine2030-N6)-methyltransferase
MEYHHSTKAGNPGDVVKHSLLAELLARMAFKPGRPVVYFEAHAGPATHLLEPGGEWLEGLGALTLGDSTATYARLMSSVAAGLVSGGVPLRPYPGSSLLAWTVLRERGLPAHVILCELNPAVCLELENSWAGLDAQAADVRAADGYRELTQALRDPIEPPSFVLLDPPAFEAVAVQHSLQQCVRARVPVLAWLPVVAFPDESPPEVDGLVAWCGDQGYPVLRATWPRPGRDDRCTRGCLCLGAGLESGLWAEAVAAVRTLGSPPGWAFGG